MIILHSSWLCRTLHLWAERKIEEGTIPSKRLAGRRPVIPASPFDADVEGLGHALAALPIALDLDTERARKRIAWLPTLNGAPVASSPLIAEPPELAKASTIAPWRVTTLPLAWLAARDLMCACLGRELLAPGILAGTDLTWWAHVFRLAALLAGQGSFLPGIRASGKSFIARWEPVLDASAQKAMDDLSHSMPGAARCLSHKATEPPGSAPMNLARGFLSWSIDKLAREAGAPLEEWKLPRRRKTKPHHESLHDAWLAALVAESGIIEWQDRQQLQGFTGQLGNWRRPLDLTAQARVRLCFRLEEPQDIAETPNGNASVVRGAKWRVRYLLQPYSDRSLLIDVRKIWNPLSPEASVLKKMAGDERATNNPDLSSRAKRRS